MRQFRPGHVTFDCYGTLTYFQMSAIARAQFAGRVEAEQLDSFVKDFSAYRFDEVLGAWKPYQDGIAGALARVCHRWGLITTWPKRARTTTPSQPGVRTRMSPRHWRRLPSTTRW